MKKFLAGIVIVSIVSTHAFCGGTDRLQNAATSSNFKSIGIAFVVAVAISVVGIATQNDDNFPIAINSRNGRME
ncbi:hypothetical protein ATZ36_08380 [Candidatus Endomicrobiellum trichonymphae]|uniref:Uncharacterized protein n=1 Tax=Endomicrobium trichonymphae TaxID=1408204 RepID=A0A1E5IGJ8_ENDTX|nr:hypothetical protein ATZ36_08380 [Candidatus Endomicrobium trichonymphae]